MISIDGPECLYALLYISNERVHEIDKFLLDYDNDNVNKGLLITLFKSKLMTGINIYDNAISRCEFVFKRWDNNRLRNGMLFMDCIFKTIKEKVIELYKDSRESEGWKVYPEILHATESKWYKNFKIIQNVIWCHSFMSKNKTVFTFIFFESIKNMVNQYEVKLSKGGDVNYIEIYNFAFKDIMIPKESNDEEKWKQYVIAYNQVLWPVIQNLILIENVSRKSKNDTIKSNCKRLFKILCSAEMITNNSTFNEFTVEVMQYIFKIKVANLDPMLDNLWNVTNTNLDSLVISDF